MENGVAPGSAIDEHSERDLLPTREDSGEAHEDPSVDVLCIQNDMPQSPYEINSFSNWKLCEDGWVRGSQGELLTWIPETMRTSLLARQQVAVLNYPYSTRLDLVRSPIGDNWDKGYPLLQPSA